MVVTSGAVGHTIFRMHAMRLHRWLLTTDEVLSGGVEVALPHRVRHAVHNAALIAAAVLELQSVAHVAELRLTDSPVESQARPGQRSALALWKINWALAPAGATYLVRMGHVLSPIGCVVRVPICVALDVVIFVCSKGLPDHKGNHAVRYFAHVARALAGAQA